MDLPLVMIMVTAAISVLALVAALVAHQRGRGPRPLLIGLGWVLLPVGLWIIGLMDLIGEGVLAAYRWLMDTPMDLQRWIGVIVAALGVLLIVAGLMVRRRTKDQAREARLARRPAAPAVGTGAAGAGTTTATGSATRPTGTPAAGTSAGTSTRSPAPTSKGSAQASDEDAEIEEILKRRGIN